MRPAGWRRPEAGDALEAVQAHGRPMTEGQARRAIAERFPGERPSGRAVSKPVARALARGLIRRDDRGHLAAVDATVIGPADLPGSMLASAPSITTSTVEQLIT